MRLSRTKVRAWSFQHPLGKPPPPLPLADLDVYVTALRSGDLSNANKIIEGHMGLAMQIVGRYVRRLHSQNRSSDLVSEAFLAVTEAVMKAKEALYDNNITPYIVSKIHSKLSAYISNDHLICVPDSTFRRYKGQRRPPNRVEDDLSKVTVNGFLDNLALREAIDKACQGVVDREIIRLRIKGLTDKEIGKAVGLSGSKVLKMRREIENRFEKGIQNGLAKRI